MRTNRIIPAILLLAALVLTDANVSDGLHLTQTGWPNY